MLFSTFPTIKALGIGSNLEKTSWADISTIAKSGEASKYFSIGDRKSITVGENTYCARIIGFNHDPLVSTIGYGTKTNGKAGITFEVKELYPEAVPYYADTIPADSYLICWGGSSQYASTLHSSVMRSIAASIPSDLRTVITWVQKDYYSFSKDSSGAMTATLNAAWDDLFILSSREMGLSSNTYNVGTTYSLYDLFGGKVSTYCRGLVNATKDSAHLHKYWVRDCAYNSSYKGVARYASLVSSQSVPSILTTTSFDASDVYTNFAFCV